MTSKGIEEATKTGKWMRENLPRFDRFLVSPDLRAVETAKLLALPNARWKQRTELRERLWKRLERVSYAEKQAYLKSHGVVSMDDFWESAPDEIEPMASVIAREQSFLLSLPELEKLEYVIVTHNDEMQSLQLLLWDIEVEERSALKFLREAPPIYNCHVLRYDGLASGTRFKATTERSMFLDSDGVLHDATKNLPTR